mmetsp:Transcript_109343/g.309318  ORF Transcript_109343/g.309318 Transcript_109343/m.309318 type:complete len:204 (-) Transcript_109343:943-1554(-)
MAVTDCVEHRQSHVPGLHIEADMDVPPELGDYFVAKPGHVGALEVGVEPSLAAHAPHAPRRGLEAVHGQDLLLHLESPFHHLCMPLAAVLRLPAELLVPALEVFRLEPRPEVVQELRDREHRGPDDEAIPGTTILCHGLPPPHQEFWPRCCTSGGGLRELPVQVIEVLPVRRVLGDHAVQKLPHGIRDLLDLGVDPLPGGGGL